MTGQPPDGFAPAGLTAWEQERLGALFADAHTGGMSRCRHTVRLLRRGGVIALWVQPLVLRCVRCADDLGDPRPPHRCERCGTTTAAVHPAIRQFDDLVIGYLLCSTCALLQAAEGMQ